jgi:hypothetical protein
MVGIKIMPDATVILIDVEMDNMINVIGGEFKIYHVPDKDYSIIFNDTIPQRRYNRLASKVAGVGIFGKAFVQQRDGETFKDASEIFISKMKNEMKKLDDTVFVDLRRIKK